MSTPTFSIGDKVTWTHVKRAGTGFGFTTREGRITGITPSRYRVKMRSGRFTWIRHQEATKAGETTALTKAFNKLAAEMAKEVAS